MPALGEGAMIGKIPMSRTATIIKTNTAGTTTMMGAAMTITTTPIMNTGTITGAIVILLTIPATITQVAKEVRIGTMTEVLTGTGIMTMTDTLTKENEVMWTVIKGLAMTPIEPHMIFRTKRA